MRLSIKIRGFLPTQLPATDVYRRMRLSLTRLGLKRVRMLVANAPDDEPDNVRCTIIGETAGGIEVVEQLTGTSPVQAYELALERFRRRAERTHRQHREPNAHAYDPIEHHD